MHCWKSGKAVFLRPMFPCLSYLWDTHGGMFTVAPVGARALGGTYTIVRTVAAYEREWMSGS